MDALPAAELLQQPSWLQEVPAHARGAAGRMLCGVHTLGRCSDEVFLVGRFCELFGELLDDFP